MVFNGKKRTDEAGITCLRIQLDYLLHGILMINCLVLLACMLLNSVLLYQGSFIPMI